MEVKSVDSSMFFVPSTISVFVYQFSIVNSCIKFDKGTAVNTLNAIEVTGDRHSTWLWRCGGRR